MLLIKSTDLKDYILNRCRKPLIKFKTRAGPWVKDLTWLQLRLRFLPWPRNSHMLQEQPKKKRKEKSIPIHAENSLGLIITLYQDL